LAGLTWAGVTAGWLWLGTTTTTQRLCLALSLARSLARCRLSPLRRPPSKHFTSLTPLSSSLTPLSENVSPPRHRAYPRPERANEQEKAARKVCARSNSHRQFRCRMCRPRAHTPARLLSSRALDSRRSFPGAPMPTVHVQHTDPSRCSASPAPRSLARSRSQPPVPVCVDLRAASRISCLPAPRCNPRAPSCDVLHEGHARERTRADNEKRAPQTLESRV
jgi:hypothetical protein